NPENGFSVLRVRVRGRREPVAVVGILPAVQPGEQLRLQGQWHTDARHGAQFRPEHAEVRPPAALEDIQRYLGSGMIRQIGPVLAANPYRLVGDVPGLGFAAADRLGQSLDIRPAAVPRLQAAVQAALLRAAEQGHTRLSPDELAVTAAGLASLDPSIVQPAIA